jgi:hypothetical protein
LVRGADDVVKADDRDVFRNAQTRIVDSADDANGGNIVEAEDGGEVARPLQERFHWLVADLRRPAVGFELNAKLRPDLNFQLASHLQNAAPAVFGVWDDLRPLHESDAAVAELMEMRERDLGSLFVIEDDVRDAGGIVVRRDSHCGQRVVHASRCIQ